MDVSQALDLSRDALFVTLLVSGPILITGVIVGVIISLVQTITQIQDQTFSLVPKIVAMSAAAVFFLPWLGQRLIEYSQQLFSGG